MRKEPPVWFASDRLFVGPALSRVIVAVRFVVPPALFVAETFMLDAVAEFPSVQVTLFVAVLFVQPEGQFGNVVEPTPDSGSDAVIVNELPPAAVLKKTVFVPFVVTFGPPAVIAKVGAVVSSLTVVLIEAVLPTLSVPVSVYV